MLLAYRGKCSPLSPTPSPISPFRPPSPLTPSVLYSVHSTITHLHHIRIATQKKYLEDMGDLCTVKRTCRNTMY